MRDGIPVTRPGRTLLDLRTMADQDTLRRAARQAEVLSLPLGEFVWDRVTSPLEDLFLRLCRRARLPEPQVNVRIGRDLVDFVWSPQRLVVETDGYRYHHGPVAFEDDRARDNRLTALGYEVLRFTHAMLTNEPRESIALVRDAPAGARSTRCSRIARTSRRMRQRAGATRPRRPRRRGPCGRR